MPIAPPMVADCLHFCSTCGMSSLVSSASAPKIVRVDTIQVESSQVFSTSVVPNISIPACLHESVFFIWALIHGLRLRCKRLRNRTRSRTCLHPCGHCCSGSIRPCTHARCCCCCGGIHPCIHAHSWRMLHCPWVHLCLCLCSCQSSDEGGMCGGDCPRKRFG